MSWGEGPSWQEDPEDATVGSFGFYAVDGGVQHGEDQQVDVGHGEVNGRGSTLAMPENDGQDNHGDVRIRTDSTGDRQLFKA